ncbi:type II toxin-antitoxin system HicA family toxin [Roseofilum sp. Guam]|uniref:type II toxin-antitoxin system HicA family toxin n=1 Tax=Roseofilum sp. Guam TaxID=2821502 RepID=UPI001B174089|nr:type II toxin-antitoxin system HicA family toxin [Roseofilum sp. Guam]MBP0028198.1 type II toxin-antitoxin system HicA family toxin [Roseofilum sp. Guam]
MKLVSGKNFCKILESNGWILKRVKGSHHIYQHSETEQIVVVPVHGNKDLKIGTLKALMKATELLEEDLL